MIDSSNNKNPIFKRLQKNFFYVIGASGGPDSMFLIEKMRNLNYNFAVAHVDYKKRAESWFDRKIVENYCKRNFIKFFWTEAEYKEKISNFQATARKIRYNFFLEVCKIFEKEYKKVSIIVAHNLEDSIETYLIQKERNSLVEFWGLSFESKWKNKDVLRPILRFSKIFINEYLEKKRIKYANDKTNQENIYRRNILRKFVFSLKQEEKKEILSEIKKRNIELFSKIKSLKLKIKEIISGDILFLNSHWKELDFEMKKRTLYFWLNNFSNWSFLLRKKKIFSEIAKQLTSRSNSVLFKFKNGFKIEKCKDRALISSISGLKSDEE